MARKQKEPKQRKPAEEYWTRVKEVVDAIFEATKDERKQMTHNLEQFQGQIWDEEKLETWDSRAVVNWFFSTVENLAPMLSDSKPALSVVPRVPHLERVGWSYTNAMSYLWDAVDMSEKLYRGVLDAMIMKKGIYEIGYDPQKESGGMFTVDVIDPRNYFIAPGYEDNWKAPLQGVREEKPLSWIRANFPKIKKITPRRTIEGSVEAQDKIKAFKYGESEDFELTAYFANVYRVWIRDEQTLVDVIQKGEKGEELLDEDSNPKTVAKKKYPGGKIMYFTDDEYLGTLACETGHNLPPWVTQDNYINPHNFLGIDENQQLEALNLEYNMQLQALTNHARKNHNPTKIIDLAVFPPDELAEQVLEEGGGVLKIDTAGITYAGKPVSVVDYGPIDQSVPTLLKLLPEAMQEVNGVTEISKGTAAKKERQSASEIAILLESSHTRTRQRVRNQDLTIKRIGYMWAREMQSRWTEPRWINWKEDTQVKYDKFGTSRAAMIEQIADPILDVIKKMEEMQEAGNTDDMKRDYNAEQIEAYENYLGFIEEFKGGKELDPVFFNFDIEVATDSSLPVDQQARANLAMKLFQMKAIDQKALLDILNWPERDEVIERREQEKAQAMAAKQGRPPGPPGGR